MHLDNLTTVVYLKEKYRNFQGVLLISRELTL